MRRRFLEDGAGSTRRLLQSLDSGFDAAGAASQFHQWVGSASLLGHSEISSLARQGEELLREEPLDLYRLRVFLTDLALTFTEQRDASAPVPEYVAEAAAGKRVALIGLTTERADALCTMLDGVKARPRLFDPSDDPASEAIRDCDLVLFHVRPETLESSWLQSGLSIPASTKLVFLGEQRDLVALSPLVRSRALDFIVGSAEPQEVLMRITFAISRSVAAAPAPQPAAPAAHDVPVRPRTAIACPQIVLADDDGIIHALVGATLQNHGMSCRSAANGHDALTMIRSQRPHAAVLDVNMPGMDGYEVLAAIRAEKIPTRVILLTSLGHEKDILRAFNLGADDYLTKPFNPFELVAR